MQAVIPVAMDQWWHLQREWGTSAFSAPLVLTKSMGQHAANIIKPISFRINRKKYGDGSVNSEEHLNNLNPIMS
jgi:hypothetical protein